MTKSIKEHKYAKHFTTEELICDALLTDGGHHKQWYLEQLLIKLVGEDKANDLVKMSDWEKGIAP